MQALEGGFSGSAITGAVTTVTEETVSEERTLPLFHWVILLISFSFLISLIVARRVHKLSKYRA